MVTEEVKDLISSHKILQILIHPQLTMQDTVNVQ